MRPRPSLGDENDDDPHDSLKPLISFCTTASGCFYPIPVVGVL